jgi:hypothetical protein
MKLVVCKPNGVQVPINSANEAMELLAHLENEKPWCGNRVVEMFDVHEDTIYFRIRRVEA